MSDHPNADLHELVQGARGFVSALAALLKEVAELRVANHNLTFERDGLLQANNNIQMDIEQLQDELRALTQRVAAFEEGRVQKVGISYGAPIPDITHSSDGRVIVFNEEKAAAHYSALPHSSDERTITFGPWLSEQASDVTADVEHFLLGTEPK